jgi:histo-blood group ABO system transferase
MMNIWFFRSYFLVFLFSLSCAQEHKIKVGLLIMATGKYTTFLPALCASADKYFLPNHERTYFIFTDGHVPESDNIVRIEQKRLGWPYDTMMRFKVYRDAAHHFADCDYLFACDADMLFVNTFGQEILGERVATRHPGYCMPHQLHDDYETNPQSRACIAPGQGSYYFAGGFYGGSTQEFLAMACTCVENIELDLAHGIIAKWHDESHLNRYFLDNPPTVILSPSYCFPEDWDLPFVPRLLALSKNHKEFQTAL